MWAQLIKTRMKPGQEDRLEDLHQQFRATEQANSGLVWSATMRDQKDPSAVYMLVMFESEEQARAREQDPRREKGLARAQDMMAEMFDGSFEFVDLEVVDEMRP